MAVLHFIHNLGRKREFQKLSGDMAATELGQIGVQGLWKVLEVWASSTRLSPRKLHSVFLYP